MRSFWTVSIAGLSKRLRDRWRTLTRVTAAALLVVPAVVPTVATIGAHAVNDDTRIRAIEWVHRNVPDGSTLLVDSYTPQVSSGRYDVVVVKGGRLMRGRTTREGSCDRVATSGS